MMKKTSWFHAMLDAILQPRQVMILDGQSGRTARNFRIRPVTILVIAVICAAAAFIAGLLSAPQREFGLMSEHLRLRAGHELAKNQLAEAEAELSLRNEQIEDMKRQFADQRDIMGGMQERVGMYEAILEARKHAGIHILRAEAKWDEDGILIYSMVLVKGGSYPRRISGHLRLLAESPEGEEITLELDDGRSELPYLVETHTFMQGAAKWAQEWRPERLTAMVFDRRGREKAKAEIAIAGDSL